MNNHNVKLYGSHGVLEVHRATGVIVNRVAYPEGNAEPYTEIGRFDPLTLPSDAEGFILDAAMIMVSGDYVPPNTNRMGYTPPLWLSRSYALTDEARQKYWEPYPDDADRTLALIPHYR